ncbi:hypothetical protein A9K97_gp457 [Tokyovirus A1]|uniref:hypothetical protein n=1 Tax=Tokyovirus A1 TaxID=1826170 RepID=UPI0007A95FE9|nr:hypothetical protein A9K97_gp457 [Tokyovirus A1]BAU79894.1 hypothetical protein [Tokyovirus A1]
MSRGYAKIQKLMGEKALEKLAENQKFLENGDLGYGDVQVNLCCVCLDVVDEEELVDNEDEIWGEEVTACEDGRHYFCVFCRENLGLVPGFVCCSERGRTPLSCRGVTKPIDVVSRVEKLPTLSTLRQHKRWIQKRKNQGILRDDREQCAACLRYRFTDTPSDFPCAMCECSAVYCPECARAYAGKNNAESDDERLFECGECPLCE